MALFDDTTLAMVAEEETAANADIGAPTYDAIRKALEFLFLLVAGTGVSGTLTSDPPNDASGVLTDSGGGFTVDAHIGHQVVFADGDAVGDVYEITDNTATTLVCSGTNLYSAGARSGDGYIVLYQFSYGQPHTHDGVDSPERAIPPTTAGDYVIARRSVSHPFSGTSGPSGYSYERAAAFLLGRAGSLRIVVTVEATASTTFRCIIARDGTAVGTARAQALTSGASYSWSEDISGWSVGDLLELYIEDAGATGTWTIEVCAGAGKFGPALLVGSEL